MKFELVQPGEYHEYFYDILDDDFKYGEIRYYDQGWRIAFLFRAMHVSDKDFVSIANKLNDLNAATEADKLFGFL